MRRSDHVAKVYLFPNIHKRAAVDNSFSFTQERGELILAEATIADRFSQGAFDYSYKSLINTAQPGCVLNYERPLNAHGGDS